MSRENTIERLMQQINGANASYKKTATEPEVPQEGHPTDKFDDRAEVPEGPEIEESDKELKDLMGNVAASAEGKANPAEDEPNHPGSENLHEGGDDADPRLKPEAGIDDPGPDSNHPASPNNVDHKYASIDDPVKLAEALESDIRKLMAKFVEFEDSDKKEPKTGSVKNVYEKTVESLKELLPDEESQRSASQKVAEILAPCVAMGVDAAIKTAAYLDVLAESREVKQAMSDEAEGAGGDGLGDIDAEIESLAAELGVSPEEVAEAVAAELSGGGVEGMDIVEGGEDEDLIDALDEEIEELSRETGIPPEEIAGLVAEELMAGGGGGVPAGGVPAGGVPAGGVPAEALMGGETPEAKESAAPITEQEYAQALELLRESQRQAKAAAAPLQVPNNRGKAKQSLARGVHAKKKLAELLLDEARRKQQSV
ncbi:MAG: hypothetical protein KatS3mg109_0060 [Pirellulaceae bacterium]|nr:MAG: hypothetical protein KatS3mg109_0060 [Pirellulaceae bacterium]